MTVTIDDIRAAAERLEGKVIRTPTVRSGALSDLCGTNIILKLENLQLTGSFKPRGAFIKLSGLSEKEMKSGVIAASAGNHAQGVAYHARQLGIPATIYMPEGTPFTKVVLAGAGLTEAREAARSQGEELGQVFVHPYDDEKIIAGQGTVGLELLIDAPDLDALVVPVGGGGLLAGSAVAAKALKPDLEIIGVEAELYPSMSRALAGGPPAPSGNKATLAEGIAVKDPGELTKPLIAELVLDIILVGEAALESAVQTYLEVQRLVTEGAGAASLAAVMENKDRFKGKTVGLVVSGGNIDSRLLSSVLMRGLVREGRLVRLRIEIPDTPGALSRATGMIGDSGGNIVEVFHQRLFYDISVKQTEIEVVLETINSSHVDDIIKVLVKAGFPTRLLGATSLDSGG